MFVVGLASLLWLLFRTGTKPSRIVYPCQRAALANSSLILGASIPISLITFLAKSKVFISKRAKTLALLVILANVIISNEQFWQILQPINAVNPNQELELTLYPQYAHAFPASDIYVVSGRANAHIDVLINHMGSRGLLFYKSNTSGANQGPNGLIARDDVVLIKINEEWPFRGGTNTDVLKELIQAIVNHPDGFVGEIVVADNGQWQGSMDWAQNNAEDIYQSTQDVVNMFSTSYNVSTFTWRPIISMQVSEYSTGDISDGYILYDNSDPETGIRVSYPKFRTQYGTYISFKHGIWNGTQYEKRLKVINVPVLKSHSWYGVTASLKHYMGVLSEASAGGLSNGHYRVSRGAMGTMMVETGLPTLNIIDAIWINANPPPASGCGPSTPYNVATRVNVLMASVDPVALDYWAAKNVLVQAAHMIGYVDTHTLDPDSTDKTGLSGEAFGVWLNRSKNEIIAAGHNVTSDKNRMNVYVYGKLVHDIAITDILVPQLLVCRGSLLDINVTIRNWGDTDENFNLTVYANSTALETAAMMLPSKNSTITTFTWNTTDFVKGDYAIRAYVEPVANETCTMDNTKTADRVVTVVSPGHDVAVKDVSSNKTTVIQGQSVTIKVTPRNVGNYTENFAVTLYANGKSIAWRNVNLESGASTTISFTWDTASFAEGNYTVSAYAWPVPGEIDTTDNRKEDGTVQIAVPVGGVDVPVDKLSLLAPYIGLASTILLAAIAAIYIKHTKHRKKKP